MKPWIRRPGSSEANLRNLKITGMGLVLVLLFAVGAAALSVSRVSASGCMGAREFHIGLAAARRGDLDKAVSMWNRVIAKCPGSYAARVNRGTAMMKRGHVIQAIQDWRRAMELAPEYAFPTDCGDYAPGFKGSGPIDFVKPIELDPSHVASVNMAGAMCLDLGRENLALELFKRSIELTRNPLLKDRLDHWARSIDDGLKD